MYYQILLIENGVYYLSVYPDTVEGKGINLKLNKHEFLEFIKGKIEV